MAPDTDPPVETGTKCKYSATRDATDLLVEGLQNFSISDNHHSVLLPERPDVAGQVSAATEVQSDILDQDGPVMDLWSDEEESDSVIESVKDDFVSDVPDIGVIDAFDTDFADDPSTDSSAEIPYTSSSHIDSAQSHLGKISGSSTDTAAPSHNLNSFVPAHSLSRRLPSSSLSSHSAITLSSSIRKSSRTGSGKYQM
jgi:hypothetical protein